MKLAGSAIILILLMTHIVFASQGSRDKGVEVIDEEDFERTLEENHNLVVYFSQDDCEYCEEFTQIYTLVAKLHSKITHFAKINYEPQSEQLFEKYEIHSTPTIVVFNKKQILQYRHEPMGTGNVLSVNFFKWIERLYLPLKHWQKQQNHSNQLVVHCNTQELKQFWKDIEIEQLWLDLYCDKQEQANEHLAVVYEYGRRVEAWQLQNNNLDEIRQKIQHLIQAFKYKYVLTWNTEIAQQVFTHNVSAFVILINNESLSHQIYSYYQQIKKIWYENASNYTPTIFSVSDLSLKTYETIKLKHYLTAYFPFTLSEYYYPIIAFIGRGERQGKYIFNLTWQKNKTALEEFISSVDDHIIKGADYKQGERKLTKWFSQQIQEYDDEQEEQLKKINFQQEWQHILSQEYTDSFFVFATWRFDYKMQILERDLREWWKRGDQKTKYYLKYTLFLHLSHQVDLPIHPDLTYQYLPTLFFIDSKKKVEKLQGVTDLQKIQKFISDQYLKEIKNNQQTQQ